MGGTEIALYQSTFIGVDLGRPRYGPGAASAAQSGIPPAGSVVGPVPPSQAGEGPGSPSVGNLQELAGGFTTEIAGRPVQIAYPFS